MVVFPNLQKLNLSLFQRFTNLYVAYSGGMDSHVMLHLLANDEHLKAKLIAVYINHGLQVEAYSWGQHCQRTCDDLGIAFLSQSVNAQPDPGESPEEAARIARYDALRPLLAENDALLVAQHAEDQVETVLLQLFRGSGLKGLSGMPESTPFAKGCLIRPLLHVSKADIIDYARAHDLCWMDDPTNQQTRYDRNYLRNEILPLLKQRWPALSKTVSRSAKHCAEAQGLIAEIGTGLLNAVINPDNTINLILLKGNPENRQVLILRQWFASLGLRMPSADVIQRIRLHVVTAQEQAEPVLQTQGHEIRRYRDKLYCLKSIQKKPKVAPVWPANQTTIQLNDGLVYELIPAESGISADCWRNGKVSVKFRSGGETLRLSNRAGSHSLKNLFQEAGIPPWERPVIPLVYIDGDLAAVGEYWIAAPFYTASGNDCFQLARRRLSIKGNDEPAIVD